MKKRQPSKAAYVLICVQQSISGINDAPVLNLGL